MVMDSTAASLNSFLQADHAKRAEVGTVRVIFHGHGIVRE